jgi:ABC-type polysaccharide/polyol phosphate transport system ATPase subunit
MDNMDISQDLVVALQDVTVKYRAPEVRYRTFKEYMIRILKREVRFKEFIALSGINMDVKQGETIGIIGRNGAGKSTLLKVISRVLIPTNGRVWIRGRVSPLLELGAGFHPELTGRENVFLNATLLGHPMRDVESHMDGIVDFAEIGDFIEAPLRTYSSGMVARLGFAVATAWEPEILILDEVLSVGDEDFRRKCQVRMESFRTGGTTTFLVSHSMETIKDMCSRVMWLGHGKSLAVGEPQAVIDAYRSGEH